MNVSTFPASRKDSLLGKDASVQLRYATVYKTGGVEQFCSGILPCLRPGMMLTDFDRDKVGVATLCTANAVTYETADGETFTAPYDHVTLEVAGPELGDGAAAPIYVDTPEGRRAGVRPSVGDFVYSTECDAYGKLIAATPTEAVFINQDNEVQAAWWQNVSVQAVGPEPSLAKNIAVPAPQADAADRYHAIALRIADTLEALDRIDLLSDSLKDQEYQARESLDQSLETLRAIAVTRSEQARVRDDEGQVQA